MICLDHFWFISLLLHAHVPPGPGPAPPHHVGHQHHENHPGKSTAHYYGYNVIWTVAAVWWQLKLVWWGWSWAECIKLNSLSCKSCICEPFPRRTTWLWNYKYIKVLKNSSSCFLFISNQFRLLRSNLFGNILLYKLIFFFAQNWDNFKKSFSHLCFRVRWTS